MAFEQQQIKAFLADLASDSPAPGGGSVAALGGALGAALVSMVSRLTVGKEKYKDNWQKMEEVLAKSGPMCAEFSRLMDEDTEAFNTFMAAMKMKKDTDDEKAARRKAMADASIVTTKVPLHTLERCVGMAELAVDALKLGNPNAASDAGSAVFFALAAAKAASYNVRINLPGVKDEAFAAECVSKMNGAMQKMDALVKEAEAQMDAMLG